MQVLQNENKLMFVFVAGCCVLESLLSLSLKLHRTQSIHSAINYVWQDQDQNLFFSHFFLNPRQMKRHRAEFWALPVVGKIIYCTVMKSLICLKSKLFLSILFYLYLHYIPSVFLGYLRREWIKWVKCSGNDYFSKNPPPLGYLLIH